LLESIKSIGGCMTEDRIKAKVQMGILKQAGEIFNSIVDPEIMNK
jgi:hypothetical protein